MLGGVEVKEERWSGGDKAVDSEEGRHTYMEPLSGVRIETHQTKGWKLNEVQGESKAGNENRLLSIISGGKMLSG